MPHCNIIPLFWHFQNSVLRWDSLLLQSNMSLLRIDFCPFFIPWQLSSLPLVPLQSGVYEFVWQYGCVATLPESSLHR